MHWLALLNRRLFGKNSSRTARRLANKRRRHDWRASSARLEELESRLALSVSMVSDLNAYSQDSNPAGFTNVNGTAYFTAYTYAGDPTLNGTTALFKSDGTAAGTAMLTPGGNQQVAGIQSSSLVSFNNKLFFIANDVPIGNFATLFSSDGTVAGTVPFLAGGNTIYNVSNLTVAGSKAFFTAYDGNTNPTYGQYDLWVTNGTSAGTHPVVSNVGAFTGAPTTNDSLSDFTNVNGKLYFSGYDPSTSTYDLWVSDGTAAGTQILAHFGASYAAYNIAAVGSEAYFELYDTTNSQYALWESNGTSGGTTQVADISTSPFYQPTAFGTKLYFEDYDPTDAPNTSYALWSSDGTAAHTGVFKYNASTTVVQSYNYPMTVMGSNLYLSAYDPTNNWTLWKTDGSSTNNKTGPVLTGANAPYEYASPLTVVNGTTLYFLASNAGMDGDNTDLWKTDGTSGNTLPVQTSGFGRGPTIIGGAVGSKLFYSAYDVDSNGNSPHGREPWVSDGTNSGTHMVTDINTVTYGSNPTNLAAVGSEIFFNASTSTPVNGNYLWQSDGTAANTLPVQTSTGTVPTGENNFTVVGSNAFFTGSASNSTDLWTTGTGTKSAVEMFPTGTNPFGGYFPSSTAFANLGGTLYFGAYDAATSQYALWKSDGTAAGTTVVQDMSPSYAMTNLTAVGGNLFWIEYDPTNSVFALWEYNGTTASLVSDLSGNESNGNNQMTAVGGTAFGEYYDYTTSKYALWSSNGTTTTNLLELNANGYQSMTSFNGKLFFAAYTNSNWVLWSSDGTVAGTTQFYGDNGQPVYLNGTPDLTVVGSELYGDFLSIGGQQMLGKTDGTAAGTVVIQEQHTGPASGVAQYPAYIVNDNGTVVFEGYDSTHGWELWQSDGTDAGTLLAADIVTGSISSYPSYLTVAGSQVFFNADDVLHGSELWTATLSATVVTAGISGPNDGVTEQYRDFVLTANDSNSGNNAAGFSFAVNFGDGSSETVTGQSGLTVDHQYAAAGSYAVTITATNLADGVTSAPVNLGVVISTTEIQNGNLALGGVPGNNTWLITHGTAATSYTVKDNGTPVDSNFVPGTGEAVILYGGNGTNTYAASDVLSTGGTLTTADKFTVAPGYVMFVKATFISAQPGAWTVTGDKGNDTFTITPAPATSGTINASLVGGIGTNSYVVGAGATLTGTIAGGSGLANTLSYSGYGTATSGVVVDLLLGQATAIDGGLSGGISGIENVTGSKYGGDILVGDANPNKLTTVAGHNIVIGGSGGGDTLTSGTKNYDILIAGTTSYDTNIPALQTILAEWKTVTAANYSTVVSTIESNSFADPLNTSTVVDSGASDLPDTVKSSGQASSDWLFVHTANDSKKDTVTNLGAGDTETSI